MLQPFQIRDLQASVSPQESEQPLESRSTPSGIIRISAADYDALASNHPRARLTYLDEDDGEETITVGSSHELSQRLEEPLDLNTHLESIRLSGNDATPMHIFDIRRSNSVTELWKRFEDTVPERNSVDGGTNTHTVPKTVVLEDQHEASVPDTTTVPAVPEDEPPSFMEAFEAELAAMLKAAEPSDSTTPQTGTPPHTEPSANPKSGQAPHPVEVLAAQVLTQLINGATMVQSEWRSKLPELQRQLQNAQRQFEAAQRTLPRNLEASLRSLLATVEAQLRAAFNNIPDSGRQMAEEAIHAGRPVAENAADGLRMMASELNEVGRTLFAAFESEFGRARPNSSPSVPNSTAETANPEASGPLFENAASKQSATPGSGYSSGSNAHPSSAVTKEESTSSSNKNRSPDTTQAGVLPNVPHGLHAPRGRFMPGHSSHWTPHPRQAPVWNPFPNQTAAPSSYHPPPLAPHIAHLPQWPFVPVRPAFDVPQNIAQTSHAKLGEWYKGTATKSLFIGNVGFQVTNKMIQDVFASKGFLVMVDLPLDTASGKHAGFGYVHFPTEHAAFAAMEALQGAVIDGHSINLEIMDHQPIENVRAGQASLDNVGKSTRTVLQAETRDTVKASGRKCAASEPFESPLVTMPESPSSNHDSMDDCGKSVTFVNSTQDVDTQPRVEALLDSPSDDTAFSARFPSLLPEMTPSSDQRLPSPNSPKNTMGMSRFPPVSQREAQLLANQGPRVTESTNGPLHDQTSQPDQTKPAQHGHVSGATKFSGSAVDPTDSIYAAKLKRRPTEHTAHLSDHYGTERVRYKPLKHSASMRQLGDDSRATAETDTWARLSRRERSGRTPNQQIPGRLPVGETMQATVSSPLDCHAQQSDDSAVEQCVTTLVDMGYGTEQDGGRSRMAVYAAAANGVLMDAIDMIEEERRVYERRASQ